MATAQLMTPDLSKDLVVERLEGENAGIVVFGINRPKAMNALSKNLVTEMEAAVNAVKFDKSVRVWDQQTQGHECAEQKPGDRN